MNIKRITRVTQHPHGVELLAILACDACRHIQFYRRVLPDKPAHLAACEQEPCRVCAGLLSVCETCGD